MTIPKTLNQANIGDMVALFASAGVFVGKVPIERGTSTLVYVRGEAYRRSSGLSVRKRDSFDLLRAAVELWDEEKHGRIRDAARAHKELRALHSELCATKWEELNREQAQSVLALVRGFRGAA